MAKKGGKNTDADRFASFGGAGVPVTSPYGYRMHPIKGRKIFHQGVDLGMKFGAPLRASYDGVIVDASDKGGYGHTVTVQYGDGSRVMYAHMDSRNVSKGQKVAAGDVVGKVGKSGNVTGPHLHAEAWDAQGRRVNPYDYFGMTHSGPVVAAAQPNKQPLIEAASNKQTIPQFMANLNEPNIFDQGHLYDPNATPAPQPVAMAMPDEGINIAQDVKAPGYEFQGQPESVASKPMPSTPFNSDIFALSQPDTADVAIKNMGITPEQLGIQAAQTNKRIQEAEGPELDIKRMDFGSDKPLTLPMIDVPGIAKQRQQAVTEVQQDVAQGKNLNDFQNALNAAIRTGSAGMIKMPFDPSRISGQIGAVGGGFLPVAAAPLFTEGAATLPTVAAVSGGLGFGNTLDFQQQQGRAPNYGEAVTQGVGDALTSVIPIAKGATMGKRVLANAALGGVGAGATNVGVQLARNGKIDTQELGTNVALGTGIGAATGIPGSGVSKRAPQFEAAPIEIGQPTTGLPVAGAQRLEVSQGQRPVPTGIDMALSPEGIGVSGQLPTSTTSGRATGLTGARFNALLDKGTTPGEVAGFKWDLKLPKDLAGAKPRYNYGQKQFEGLTLNDVDKALFIVAQKNPSKRDADYMSFLREVMPGVNDAAIRQFGKEFKDSIKPIAKAAEGGSVLDIPAWAQSAWETKNPNPSFINQPEVKPQQAEFQTKLPVDPPLFTRAEAGTVLQAMNESKELDMPFADFAERFSVPYTKKGTEITVFVPGAGKIKVSDQISTPGFFAELGKRQGAANPYKSLVTMMTKGEQGEAAFMRELGMFSKERMDNIMLVGETPDNAAFVQAMDLMSRKGERDANIQTAKESDFADYMMQQRQAYLDDINNSLPPQDLHDNLNKAFLAESSDFGRNVDEGFWSEAADLAAKREAEMNAPYESSGRPPNALEKAQLDRQLENQMKVVLDEQRTYVPENPQTEMPKTIAQQMNVVKPLEGDWNTASAQALRGSGFNSLEEAQAYNKIYREQFQGAAPPRNDLKLQAADIPNEQVPMMANQYKTALESEMIQAPNSYVKKFLERVDLANKGELTKAQVGAIKADFMMLEHYKQQGLYEQTLGAVHPHMRDLLRTEVDPATGIAKQLPLNEQGRVPTIALDEAVARGAGVTDLKRILPAMNVWDDAARNGTKVDLSYIADIAGPRGGIQDKGLVTPLGFAVTKKGILGVGYNRDGHMVNYYFNRTAEGSMMTKIAPSDVPADVGLYPSVYGQPGVFDGTAWLNRKPQPPTIMNTSQSKVFIKVLENARRLGATAELTDDIQALINKTIKQGKAAEVSDLNKIYTALQESPLENVRAFCNALDLGVK